MENAPLLANRRLPASRQRLATGQNNFHAPGIISHQPLFTLQGSAFYRVIRSRVSVGKRKAMCSSSRYCILNNPYSLIPTMGALHENRTEISSIHRFRFDTIDLGAIGRCGH